MSAPRKPLLAAADLEWEEPPHQGRAPSPEILALIDQVKAMVPALRERPDRFAVVEVFDGPKTAGNRANTLKKKFGTLDTIESRLQFRGALIIEEPEKSKLYVRLRPVK